MKILYVVINSLDQVDSGSGMRPNCMLRAFRERGHEVYVVSGAQGFSDRATRTAAVEKGIAWAEENHPDLCYIESSTYPIIHHCDYKLIRYLHKKKIPSSYFYRDVYRRFPDLFHTRSGFVNEVKEFGLRLLQRYTDHMLKKLDVIYFPGERYARHFHFKHMEWLPPAGEIENPPEHPNQKTCIYVGGITELYGFPLMMEALNILNKDQIRYKLILVCREPEWKKYNMEHDIPQWLEVHHASGKALEPLYARADLALLALRYNEYAHLQIGIKLYQYASYGLPVLSTNVYTMSQIIRENNFGEVAEDNAQDYAAAISRMLEDDDKLKAYRASCLENIATRHLWVHRVDKVVADMMGVRR